MDSACTCGHCCGKEKEAIRPGAKNYEIIRLFGSAFFFAAALFIPIHEQLRNALYMIVYLVSGFEVLLYATKNIIKGKIFDENFLMALASIGAILIGELTEAVAVMLFYRVGELLQNHAVDRSRRSIQKLMDIRPDRASRFTGKGMAVECAAQVVMPGELILVKAGERIPLDGVVTEGESQLDTSALTGEPIPRDVTPGSEVLAGFINLSGTMIIRVTKPFGETTAAKILELAENASENKAPAEQFITKFARYYTPAVVFIAVLIAFLPPLLAGEGLDSHINRALVFLVISCPCALVLSVPMGYFAGIGCASSRGILLKGGNYLDSLRNADIMVFDKTGTLTHGQFQVKALRPEGLREDELIEYAALAEYYSNHPIAQCIRASFPGELDPSSISECVEQAGSGVKSIIDGKNILVGNERIMKSAGIPVPQVPEGDTPVFLAIDGVFKGTILIGDTPKAAASQTIQRLRSLGVKRIVMLTGDRQIVGERVGREVGVDEVFAELLPGDKLTKIEELMCRKRQNGALLYIGDGINDAPALARADVGIAMGGLGADAALEAADMVIMDDALSRLPEAIQIARHTRLIVTQNIVFVLSVKLIFLLLGAMGLASMWAAVFADVGVSVLAVLNSLRALRTKFVA